MANPDKASVVEKLARAQWAGEFKAVYGEDRRQPPTVYRLQLRQPGHPTQHGHAANQNPASFDLGLCGRPDLRDRDDLCGAFKVPSLRNVALRQVLFHNGKFKSLKDALTFYVQRDTSPQMWYPRNPDGSIAKFDDLPVRLHSSVNTNEAPYDRKPGDMPALNDREIDDVIAFLRTLSDGWRVR